MDPVEEQQQELEVLESIYPDELTLLNETTFIIRINLDTPSERKHALNLQVKYPPTYPEVIPELYLDIAEDQEEDESDEYDDDYYDDNDDDEDDEDTKAAKLALNMSETIEFTRTELNQLLGKLNEEAEMNIGMPSVFALTTLLKDEAELLFEQILKQKEQDYEHERELKEQEEQKKFIGTKVTKESFSKWRDEFRKEIKYDEQLLERFEKMHQGKLTGRQIFEKGLAGNEDDTNPNDDEIVDSMKKVTV
ncbi:GIR2 [[Candida] subhashii]|uniref:GIR2 n=1 Tax=[Candida] subhashii TaxID=561895 RepID=A0A8J5QB31_9ASCO|nr:GIR2 [[Candida] subhashii]KAG7663374.1 GIR2 [[Candida] subhashii]